MDTPTDEQLILRLQQGQTAALDELYKRYAKKLYAFCFHSTRSSNPQDSEDLVQDIFLRVVKGAHTFKAARASFRTWLFTIARNHCIDVIRHGEKIKIVPIGKRAGGSDDEESLAPEDTLVDQSEDAERLAVRTSIIEAVSDCISELDDEEERQAILLYYLGDKVYREIGEILGISTSTAKNRVESAQNKLKLCLESKGIDSPS